MLKKYKLEIIIFVVNIVYMVLELIASRILSPYFGSSNLVWTSVIGIILLSTSIGNYFGGKFADNNNPDKCMKIILGITGVIIMLIPIIQIKILNIIVLYIHSIKIGAIVATLIIFFIPAMLIGMLSPLIIKLKMESLNKVGQISGKIYAIATLGSIIGTFLGGFYLIPHYGCNEILFVLSVIIFLVLLLSCFGDILKKSKKIILVSFIGILINSIYFYSYSYENKINSENVLKGKIDVLASFDTEYGRALITNTKKDNEICRYLIIDKGNESATFIDEEKCYELANEYTKYYDLMFKSQKDINDVLMIGGAGYSYPKYFISKNSDKNMDVVEIDGKVTEIAKKYFFLDKLIDEYDLNNNKRLKLIEEDGRIFLNKNKKKYDAILNDAFSGLNPVKTLTTIEAVEKIYNSLNEDGLYLTNIISSIDGKNSKFIKAEIKTLKQIFKNVYVIPCKDRDDIYVTQNIMVIATDQKLLIDKAVDINFYDSNFLTDNYCPVDNLIPQ